MIAPLACLVIVGQTNPFPLPSNLVGSLRSSNTKSYKQFRIANSNFNGVGPDYISISVSRKMRQDGAFGLTNDDSLKCEVIIFSLLDAAGKKASRSDRSSAGWKRVSYKQWNGEVSGYYQSSGKISVGFGFNSGNREVGIRLEFASESRAASLQASDLVVDILNSIKESK